VEKGKEVLAFIRPKGRIQATKIDERLEEIVAKQIKTVYEPKFGGFGGAPKFPHTSTLLLAMELYRLRKDPELLEIVEHSLDTMTLGGLYDLVDGGFCRYSTDEAWLVPHFEKMTYDNALMAEVLIRAWQLTGRERYRRIAFETLDFMLERMREGDLFFSASDADTEGVEGKYFVYDYEKTAEAFRSGGIADPEGTAARLTITPEGNFEGHSIARLQNPEDREDTEVRKALEILKNIRTGRRYPFIDRKVQSSWNAMMIRALFTAGEFELRYREQAVRSLEALESTMAAGVTIYHSALMGHPPKSFGFLEDYAWWGSALMVGYQSTLDERYLIRATELANEAVRRFWADGRWRIDDGEFRQFADDTDSGYPSSVGVLAHWMQSLRSLVDPVYEKFLYRTLEVHSYDLIRQPVSRPTLASAALRWLRDDLIIKAREEKLMPYIQERMRLGYPWLFYRTALNENYMLCNNRSCFAEEETFESIRQAVQSMVSSPTSL